MSAAALSGFTVNSRQERQDNTRGSVRQYFYVQPSSPTSSVADEFELRRRRSIDELLELRKIGSNWDGEGAAAPVPELIDSAISLINQNKFGVPPSRIVPVNDGRVSLEWDTNGYFISLRIESRYQGRKMLVKPNGATVFSVVNWSEE